MTTTVSTPSLAPLLAGYISGAISDDAMMRFDDLFEASGATPSERLAFARFYLDAVAAGDDQDALPRQNEVDGILAAARA
ncbi:MAG: hypothetical protein AAGK21_08095 [Bacteroidota bacterium]